MKVWLVFQINGKTVRKVIPVIFRLCRQGSFNIVAGTKKLALVCKKIHSPFCSKYSSPRIWVKPVTPHKPKPEIDFNELKLILTEYVKLRGGDPETLSFKLI